MATDTRMLAAAVAVLLVAPLCVGGAEPTRLEPIVVGAPTRLEVFPEAVRLASPQRRMRLIVTGHYADGSLQDLSRAAEFRALGEGVARVDAGVVVPAGNGQTEIVVKVADRELKVPVEVSRFEQPEPVSFHYAVLPVLTKRNCNSGACHGSPSGKGGFRLSLRAYDRALDAETLVREAFNRRTDLLRPERSLLLRKPAMELPHGGGRRLRKSDADFALLRDWIAEGCRVDAPTAPQCVKLEVYPRQRVVERPAHTQQMLALAHFSDGSVRDVTHLALLTSSDEAVATVSQQGLVVAQERGETAVLVRFLDQVETASLTFLKPQPDFAWQAPPEQNFVDRHVFQKLRQLQIVPSPLCSDDEFLRRAYLDVIGLLPTVAETEAFLADADPLKRSRTIDRLLERPEHAEFWALKWGDLLRIRNAKVSPAGVHKFHRWLVTALRENLPYDEFARRLLTASGSTFANPAANFYRTAAETNDCTETSCQVFLGVRIQCAKCHNHPFERWTQDNYYGIAAFFPRVRRTSSSLPDEQIISTARGGEVTQPRTGKTMRPWLPLVGEVDVPADEDRRQVFAAWLTRSDNPFFARMEVNRVWGQLLGRGIVEPVDDFRDSNPPASAALLAALADDFVAHGFDRRHLLRQILHSSTYQLSSRSLELNHSDDKYFSHARTRLLTAEQLLDAICQVTEVGEKFAGLPASTRATQLPSPDVDSEFLKVFGQPARETACQCERSSDSNLSQALQMINGPLVHAKMRSDRNRLKRLAAAGQTNAQIVGELYLAALCRRPLEAELAAAVKHVESQPDRQRGLEDVCWAVLNTNEFLFQH